MITVMFGDLMQDGPIWSLIPDFTSVFPENVDDLTQDMEMNIAVHYWYREIGFSNPSRFLLEFQRTVRQRAHVWKMLIDSEAALTPDEMTYNYDMTENRDRTLNISGENVRTPNLKRNQTATSDSTGSGTTETEQDSTDTRNNRLHQMDTPDGVTNDIDNYLSYADKSDETDTVHAEGSASSYNNMHGVTTSNSTETGRDTTETEQTHVDSETITRKGNIGVQTAGQILQYWRQAEAFSAYEMVIFPELDHLFLGTADLDEGYAW